MPKRVSSYRADILLISSRGLPGCLGEQRFQFGRLIFESESRNDPEEIVGRLLSELQDLVSLSAQAIIEGSKDALTQVR